jgi:uncharacterized secreted protein with C-terminal beta-propeller domain
MTTETQKINVTFEKDEFRNVTCLVNIENLVARVRIKYSDHTRKNAAHKDRRPVELYFEGFQSEFNSHRIENVVDFCLRVERRIEYILYEAFSDQEKQEREKLQNLFAK